MNKINNFIYQFNSTIYKVPFIKRHFSGDALSFCKVYSLIYTPILIIVFILSLLFENSFLNFLVQTSMGITIFHMGYVFCIVIAISEIYKSEEDRIERAHINGNSKKNIFTKNKYIGILKPIFLLVIFFSLSYFPYRYNKKYSFKCETFYLDTYTGIYHIYDDCECITSLDGIERCKGSSFINTEYKMCELCVETQEDLDGYASDHYHHPD